MNLHLIDENGELSAEGELTNHLSTLVSSGDSGLTTEERLRSVGVKYHVVGVFGGQSSGKSTLLNKLFSTDFQTLDETVRRGQTTKGAFLNCAQGSNQASPLLVVDFEGTDGVERGEDQSFERQLSLFGLCVADTLIVNMWAVDVGRYNAANLSLLRTMFEVNLQLFSHDSYHAEERPTLLIVLRDFTEEDTAPSLKTIRTSFDTIWDGVARPAKFAKATIDDVFLLKFYFLPHYKLQQEQFSHSLDSLRDWFTSPQCPEYLFRHESMFRGVPLEGLPAYLNNCWEAIRTSKDLDIPSQRNMLAHHRCFEVKTQEVDAHTEYCREFEARIERGEMIEGLVTALDEEMTKRLASYTTHTTLYQQDVVSAFAEELQQELQALSVRTMNLYARNIATVALGGIESAVQSAVDDSIRQVLKAAHTFQLPPKSSTDDQEDAQVVLDKQTCNEFVRTFWSGMCRRLNKAVDQLRADPPAHSLFGKYTSAVSADPTMRAAVANQVTRAVFTKTHTRLAAMAETASETAHRGFEHCLTHGPDGSISFFSTTKGLLRAVPSAQLAGLSVLSCLLYFRLRLTSGGEISKLDGTKSCCARQVAQERRIFSVADQDEERSFFLECTSLTSLPVYPIGVNLSHAEEGEEDTAGKATSGIQSRFVLMNAQAVSRAYELFSQKCEFTMQLQIRTLEASKQRLPAWVFPVMLLLGWNELWYVLTSPTLLLLVIVVVALFFQGFIRTKWEEFQETGPASVVIPAQSAVRYMQQLYEHANDTMIGTSPGTRSGDAGGDQNDIELTTIPASKKSQ